MSKKTWTAGPCKEVGCDKPRHKMGLCHVHARVAGLYFPLPMCATEGCPRKARTNARGSQCRHCRAGLPVTAKRSAPRGTPEARVTCTVYKCGACQVRDELCQKHLDRRGTSLACAVDGCASSRYRARLCSLHGREFACEINPCRHPSCTSPVWRDSYCGLHVGNGIAGLDIAAGDWFDWVAADRLYRGLPVGREPTPAEVLAVIRRAERDEIQYTELADRIGISSSQLEQWRYHSQRLVGAA